MLGDEVQSCTHCGQLTCWQCCNTVHFLSWTRAGPRPGVTFCSQLRAGHGKLWSLPHPLEQGTHGHHLQRFLQGQPSMHSPCFPSGCFTLSFKPLKPLNRISSMHGMLRLFPQDGGTQLPDSSWGCTAAVLLSTGRCSVAVGPDHGSAVGCSHRAQLCLSSLSSICSFLHKYLTSFSSPLCSFGQLWH